MQTTVVLKPENRGTPLVAPRLFEDRATLRSRRAGFWSPGTLELSFATLALVAISLVVTFQASSPPTNSKVSTTYERSTTHGQYTVYIAITDGGFQPPSLKVVIGVNNTVVWLNLGSQTHSVTSITGKSQMGEIDSRDWVVLGTGKSWNYTFTSPGIFYYGCAYHSEMQGSVTVER